MINIFQASANDQSLFYLAQIFGYVGTVLPISGSPSLILGVMFKTFNTIVLSVAVLIVVYITVIGVMKTAAEGEMLGKHWNSLWVPIRMVLGIAALVPSASGYSAIQIVMMWVIVQGIGAADTIWNSALAYIDIAGSPYAGVNIPATGVTDALTKTFQGLVCAATARQTAANPTSSSNGAYYCATNPNDPFCSNQNPYDLQQNSTCTPGDSNGHYGSCVFSMGPQAPGIGALCGSLTYCNQDTTSACYDNANHPIPCAACKAQASVLQAIVQNLGAIADQVAQADVQYRNFFDQGGAAPAWTTSYCSANGLAGNQCCRKPAIVLPGMTANNKCALTSTLSDSDNGDNTNENPNVINGLIWPYLLSPLATVGNTNFVDINTNQYVSSIIGAVTTEIVQMAQNMQNNTQQMPQVIQNAQSNGWILAGAFYYYFAQLNNNNLADANPTFSFGFQGASQTGGDPSTAGNPLHNYRNNYVAAGNLINYLTQQAQGNGASSSIPPQLGGVASAAFSTESGIFNSFMHTVTGGSNGQMTTSPLSSIQSLGEGILISVEVLFTVLVILYTVLSILGFLDFYVLGTGATNPAGPTLATVSWIVVPLLFAFMGTFTAIGATLAVYVPLIPYIVFTFAAIGWFISVIEAMIAGPLVALGILSPNAQHELLGKSEHAIMYLFSIFLRPGLMIFGLIASMLLASVVVTMINAGFEGVMLSITSYQLGASSGNVNSGQGHGAVDLLELIFFMAAYVMLVVSALNKCFALIHIIPDRTLRWIGGHPEESGAGEALSEVKGGVGSAAGRAGAAAEAGPQSAAKAGQKEGEGYRARKKAGEPEVKKNDENNP